MKLLLDTHTFIWSIEDDKRLSQKAKKGIEILSINFEHTLEVSKLEFHHKDPFDRLIIAQAKIENMTIVSKDILFDDYDIKRLW